MLRPRSENTRLAHRNKKTEENNQAHAPIGKQELQQPQQNDATTLLKDKDVNQQRSLPSLSTKSTEKDRITLSPLKTTSQRGSQFKVFIDKENDRSTPELSTPLRKKTNITPVKRPGSNLETWSPISKRLETEAIGSSASSNKNYYKEEELPYNPEVELDFSVFDDRLDFGVYEQISLEEEQETTPTKIHLDSIREEEQEESIIQLPSSPFMKHDEQANAVDDLGNVQFPSEIEYGPPKEKELAYEPEVSIDVSVFSELLPDIAAYEYEHPLTNETFQGEDDQDLLFMYTQKWMSTMNDNDDDTEEFELLDHLDQDASFFTTTIEETEQDPELLFANHLFDVDDYMNNQQTIC